MADHRSQITLQMTKRTDARLLELMQRHYSQPKGFVGRNICYAILCNGGYFGHIVAGSATKFLPGRNTFFGIERTSQLVHVVNNIFFHVEPFAPYPLRNFTSAVVAKWRDVCTVDWSHKYGDQVWGFETLVELPRRGELYRRDGWLEVGTTHGYTCKRVAGKGTDSWTGKRVWNVTDLRPKIVLVRKV